MNYTITGVSLAKDILAKGRAKAKRARQSFSKYIETLIFKDLIANKAIEFPKLEQESNDNRTD